MINLVPSMIDYPINAPTPESSGSSMSLTDLIEPPTPRRTYSDRSIYIATTYVGLNALVEREDPFLEAPVFSRQKTLPTMYTPRQIWASQSVFPPKDEMPNGSVMLVDSSYPFYLNLGATAQRSILNSHGRIQKKLMALQTTPSHRPLLHPRFNLSALLKRL